MKQSLKYFKDRYKDVSKKTIVHEIGFEDYFLIHFLVCYKEKITNPHRYDFKECLRCFFIDSIFNNGKIQEIYLEYPTKFVDFLLEFDKIFTTNYDRNIELATCKEVYYLHGAFHHFGEVYDPDSLRNKLSDSPIKSATIEKGFVHLYSDALTSYSGDDKQFVLDMGINANIAIEKFATGLDEKPELWNDIETWKDSDNPIIRNLYESIMLKRRDTSLRFKENKSLKDISELEGQIVILGLSPNNDTHIFKAIEANSNIKEIIFYYYDFFDTEIMKRTITNKYINFVNVSDFWISFI